MSVILEVIANAFLLVIRYLLEIPIIWIGEITLWCITLGARKPRWDCHIADGGGDYVFLSEASFWIGVATVCVIGLAIKAAFFQRM
jgi:hypothetical protein